MSAGRTLSAFLLANVMLLLTFVFLPVLLLTDNISIFQNMLNYINKSS
ncbi:MULTISPECIES: hypothetical protein [Sinobaca]|uniref:Uncharacterized protein n=1 Tax=Sinobaca qinghaiensis TaxID=342944 RepID=A0A419V0I7_9BACL|nr:MULTISPECIES: hypothetical protein [Sinobaca]RKD71431.1 hypothetical protein ATL39_2830 [Sinobaca qinghaiensis]